MTLNERLNERLKDAIHELECWQSKDDKVKLRRASTLHWAFKVTSLASQLADEAVQGIIDDMKIEENRANRKDNGDE